MTERVDAYAAALFEVALAEGRLAHVEDDLFRFARTLEGSDDLRSALTDPGLPVERRVAVVEELMGGKALATSAALVGMVVAAGRAADLPAIVDAFVARAAAERSREVAEVRSALPSTRARPSGWPPRWAGPPASRSRSRSWSTRASSAASWPASATPSSTARSAIA